MWVTTGESYLKPPNSVPAPSPTETTMLATRPTPAGIVHVTAELESQSLKAQSCGSGFEIVTAGCSDEYLVVPKFIPYTESTDPPVVGPLELEVPVITGES